MFERVILRRSVNGSAITAGELAEALLFYQNVHLVLDQGSLMGLDSSIGMQTLLALLSKPGISATYIEEMTGTQTEQTAYGPQYSLVAYTLLGHQNIGQRRISKKKRLEYILERCGHKKVQARRLVKRFRRLVKIKKVSDDYFVKGGVIAAARVDLTDENYVDAAARVAAKQLLGQEALPADFYFLVQSHGDKFSISTNLDFGEITSIQQAIDPNAGEYTAAHLASTILSASIGTIYAGHYGGDFYTSTTESRIIQVREQSLLERTQRDQAQIENFKSVAISDSPSVAEVINSGERSFSEFLEVLKSANKFKEWLRGKSPDENLVSAYIENVTEIGWLNKIPGKSIRYVVGAAIGAIEPFSGLAISAGDSFFLDKLIGGWRPNHFVSKELSQFLNPANEQ